MSTINRSLEYSIVHRNMRAQVFAWLKENEPKTEVPDEEYDEEQFGEGPTYGPEIQNGCDWAEIVVKQDIRSVMGYYVGDMNGSYSGGDDCRNPGDDDRLVQLTAVQIKEMGAETLCRWAIDEYIYHAKRHLREKRKRDRKGRKLAKAGMVEIDDCRWVFPSYEEAWLAIAQDKENLYDACCKLLDGKAVYEPELEYLRENKEQLLPYFQNTTTAQQGNLAAKDEDDIGYTDGEYPPFYSAAALEKYEEDGWSRAATYGEHLARLEKLTFYWQGAIHDVLTIAREYAKREELDNSGSDLYKNDELGIFYPIQDGNS